MKNNIPRLTWALIFLLLTSVFAHAVDPLLDNFDYRGFNDYASNQIDLEMTFLEQLQNEAKTSHALYGFWLVDFEDELNKLDLVSHYHGLQAIQACITKANIDGQKAVWDELSSVEFGVDVALSCSPSWRLQGAGIVAASSVPVAEIASLQKPFNFNPVVATLIQAYKRREIPTNDVFEERMANNILFAAERRETLGAATMVDFGRLKYRFSFGVDADTRSYYFETLLQDYERIGISALAECIRQDDLPREWAAYARNGNLPTDSELQTTAFFHPCLYRGKIYRSMEYVQEKISPDVLRDRFAAMGLAIQGRNVFLAKGANQARPSIVYDYLFAENDAEREKAGNMILAIDDFVNQHVAKLRSSLSPRRNFRGIASLSVGERIILSDLLEKRYIQEHARRFTKMKLLKQFDAGVESCMLGVGAGEIIGGTIGTITEKVFFTPGLATPQFQVAGAVLMGGFMLYSGYKVATETVDLVNKYRSIPLSSSIAGGCAIASDLLDFGVQAIKHFHYKDAKTKGAAMKDVVPAPKTRVLPEGVVPAVNLIPTRTAAQRLADAVSRLFSNPGSVDVGALSRQWTESALSRAKDGLDSSVRWVRQRSQDILSQRPSARQELLDLTSSEYKTKLDDLRAAFDNAETPAQRTEITKQLKAGKEEAVGHLFETAVTDSRLLLVQSRDDSWRLVYVPKNPSDVGIPKNIVDQFKTFQKSVKDAGVDTFALRATPQTAANPHGVYIDSLSNYHAHFENPDVSLAEKVRILSDLYAPRQVVGGGPEINGLLGQTRKQMLDNFRANLPYQEYKDLSSVLDRLVDPDTFAPSSEGVTAALGYHDQRLSGVGADYNSELMTLMIAALDPDMSSNFDPVGQDAPFLSALGSRKGAQVKLFSDSRRQTLVNELNDRLGKFFQNVNDESNNKAIEGIKEQIRALDKGRSTGDAQLLKTRREYEEDIILGFIESTQSPDGLGPHYKTEDFDYVLTRYGFVDEPRAKFFKRLNDQWRTTLDETVKHLSNGELSLENVRRVVVNKKLGAGAERTAYSITIQTKAGQEFRLVGKTGRTDPGELLFFEKHKKSGHVPEVFRAVYGGDQGLMLQEEVIGKTLRQKLAETPQGPKRDALLKAVAELDEYLASQGIDIGDAGGRNIIIRDSDGMAILVDADTRQISSRDELDTLIFNFVRRDLDFTEVDYQAYFRRLLDRYKQRYGDAEGSTRFVDLLKKARDELKEGVFQLLPRYADENSNFAGSEDFLIHLFQGNYITRSDYVHTKTKLDADDNVVPDFDWHERIPRAINEFLNNVQPLEDSGSSV